MFDRLAEIEQRYMDLADQVNDPDIIANQTEWRRLMKEYSDLTPIVEAYREYKQNQLMRKMSSWKSAVVRAAMKRHCLQGIYTGCTRGMLNAAAGKLN